MDQPGRVRVEHRDAAAVVWLDNQQRRNALSRAMLLDLFNLLQSLDDDPEVGCIVIRGAGGTFCSGLDLTSMGAAAGTDEHSMVDLAGRLDETLGDLETMTVAVIEGYAIGAGCQIALGCTMRLVTPGASFGVPVSRLGLVYPPLSVQRLVDLVGASRAMYMISTGRRVDAATAHAWGLATQLLGGAADGVPGGIADGITGGIAAGPGGGVDAALDAFLADLAAGSRLSIDGSLDMVRAVALDACPAAQGERNRVAKAYERWSQVAEESGEHAEALAARAEKRTPQFPWRPSH